MNSLVAGAVALGTAVVGASIVYQIVNGKNSNSLASTGAQATTTVVGTLFK